MEALNQTTCEVPTRTGSYTAAPAERPFHETRAGWLALALVWAASAAYLGFYLRQGWLPADAGLFGQMGERVLRGQVPYRDFIEIYTGGLTYLDAAALRLFGDNLFSQRIPLFLFFLGWVPAVYFIARRFAGPILAGMVTLLSVAWSVPVYPEAMTSWYNLFFATWGTLALFRYIETEKRRWLWVAGLCAGLSFLVKMVALYFVAAALLFFVFRELSSRERLRSGRARGTPYRIFASVGLLAFVAALIDLVFQRPTGANFFYFVLPSACLVAMLLWGVWLSPSAGNWAHFGRLFSMALPFLGGAVAPVVLFLAFLARAGALEGWVSGMLHASIRMQWLAFPMIPPLVAAIGLVPFAAILALGCQRNPRVRRWTVLAAVPLLFGCLILSRSSVLIYMAIGRALPILVPLLALFALAKLPRAGTPRGRGTREKAFLLLAVAALCSLVQYPQGLGIYFLYVAPLAILSLLGLLWPRGGSRGFALMAVVAFYAAFAIWLRPPAYFTTALIAPDRASPLVPLDVPRSGGLLVKRSDATEYEKLVPLVQAHAHGAYIYCTPDCPEVYFLSGKLNPTPTLDDFLDPDFLDVPGRTARILSTLDDHGVSLVVFNHAPFLQSGPVPAGLRAALDARFPNARTVGGFEVRWKR